METRDLKIIGNNVFVEIAGVKKIPAKVDTGADSSAIWASHIRMNAKNQLEFRLFGPKSPLYTGETLTARKFSVKQVRSSNGQVSMRYCVPLMVKISDRTIRANFTLANRARNRFPILIGRKTLQNKFLVDVSKIQIPRPPTFDNKELNTELKNDPQAFHKKYMEKSAYRPDR